MTMTEEMTSKNQERRTRNRMRKLDTAAVESKFVQPETEEGVEEGVVMTRKKKKKGQTKEMRVPSRSSLVKSLGSIKDRTDPMTEGVLDEHMIKTPKRSKVPNAAAESPELVLDNIAWDMADDPADASMRDHSAIDLKQVVFPVAKEICLRGNSVMTDKGATIEEILRICHNLLDIDDESDGLFRSRKEFFYQF